MSLDSPATDAIAAAIRDVHRTWLEAIARGDTETLRELLDPNYELWLAGRPIVAGREAAVAAMAPTLVAMDVKQSFESAGLIVGADWAVDRGVEHFVITPREGGAPRTHTQRAVVLLRRSAAGRWVYAWGMTSPITVPAAAEA